MAELTIKHPGRDVPAKKCGPAQKTLIIASIGTANPHDPVDVEVAKAEMAQALGADVITDHSFYGDLEHIHRRLLDSLSIPLSTVACYEFGAVLMKDGTKSCPSERAVAILERQARSGVALITVHAALRRQDLVTVAASARLIPMGSKGGGILSGYMQETGRENPYYEYFDSILEICATHAVVISLGTALRPCSVCDRLDDVFMAELTTMGELVSRAQAAGVGVMIEGVGHALIDAIPEYIRLAKQTCGQVPYRVLPMVTDTALGCDHISGAIGTAVSVAAGADAVTCISRSEHIGLPSLEDLREAIIATKVAAYCGELVKLRNLRNDHDMSRARWKYGCKGDWSKAILPDIARTILEERGLLGSLTLQCSMCGEYCGIKASKALFRGDGISGR